MGDGPGHASGNIGAMPFQTWMIIPIGVMQVAAIRTGRPLFPLMRRAHHDEAIRPC